MKRRALLKWTGLSTLGTLAAGGGGYGLWRMRGERSYRTALRTLYRPADLSLSDSDKVLREVARYATMAPNSHNTQPWRMSIGESALELRPDARRLCPIVDPDQHHVFISLGCAAENAIHAASAFGLDSEATFDEASDTLRIEFSRRSGRAQAEASLFDAVPRRQSTRGEFDGRALSSHELGQLERAGTSAKVAVTLVTGDKPMDAIQDLVIEGNRVQMHDPEFVAELRHWIRTSYSEALATGDGLFAMSSGNPAVPTWIGEALFDLVYTLPAETETFRRQLRSSAGVALFSTEAQSKSTWVEVGRCFERFALRATSMGVLHSHLNQPIEVAALRPALRDAVGIGSRRPNLVIRFGRGRPLPRSLRRPLEDVLDT